MSPPNAAIAPEYRDLHAMYVRSIEIQEAILTSRPNAAITSALLPELLLNYCDLSNSIAHLLIFLQSRLPLDPELFCAWREASTRLKP